MTSDISESVLALAALEERDAQKARTMYIAARKVADIDDAAVCEQVEDLVCEAIVFEEPVVEIDRRLVEVLLLLAKGRARKRGGQHIDRRSRRCRGAIVEMGRWRKARCMAEGMSATEAHLEGAAFAAAEARKRGITYSEEYLAREMHRREGPRKIRQ